MIPAIRKRYNAAFSQAQYDAFIHDLNTSLKYPADFKVSETPLFLLEAFARELLAAGEDIIRRLRSPDYHTRTDQAVPPVYRVPREDDHPLLLQLDFAICQDGSGFVPRLIELQGFPSLYCFQAFLDLKTRQYFDLPAGFTGYFSRLDYATYIQRLRECIVGSHDPRQVVLLEVTPDQQSTRIDFACTEHMLGIPTVDVAHVYRRGDQVFCRHDDREIRITRIYNRVIRDDAKLANSDAANWMTADLDVSWAGHPNWYYRISKYSLPLLKSSYASEAHFVSDLATYPPDLNDFVLKPLFLYSGQGVQLDVTPAMLDSLPDKREFIVQRKVTYAPLVETPDGYAFAEVRMLYLWPDDQAEPFPVSNLVRMSKGRMMGVRYNRNKTWVGSSIAYFPADV